MEVAESSKGWGASGVSLTVPVQMSAGEEDLAPEPAPANNPFAALAGLQMHKPKN